MTQSPEKENTTISDKKDLNKSVGYSTIFSSGKIKFELTTQESFMRCTRLRDEKNYLYAKVEDPEEIEKIERLSENWTVYEKRRKYNYIIMVQCNAENKLTGYCKVIKVEADPGDWTYYKRR